MRALSLVRPFVGGRPISGGRWVQIGYVIDSSNVSLRYIANMNVIPYAGTIVGRIVISKYFEFSLDPSSDFDRARYQVRLRFMQLPDPTMVPAIAPISMRSRSFQAANVWASNPRVAEHE